jgi:endonuclease/exonuclease/phosphatase (EEP) superfamily protein YafD
MAWMQIVFLGSMTKPFFFAGDCNQQPVPWSTPERHNELEREGERSKQPG